jgi:hypothetical protein
MAMELMLRPALDCIEATVLGGLVSMVTQNAPVAAMAATITRGSLRIASPSANNVVQQLRKCSVFENQARADQLASLEQGAGKAL